MAIVWQSMAAPSFGDSNALFDKSASRISGAIDSAAQISKDRGVKEKEDSLKAFRQQTLDLAMDDNLNEKELLGKVLRYGQENGISQENSLAQVESLKKLRNTMVADTQEQEGILGSLGATIQNQQQRGPEAIEARMAEWDAKYDTQPEWSTYSEIEKGLNPSSAVNRLLTSADDSDFFWDAGDRTGGVQLDETVQQMLKHKTGGEYTYSGIAIQAAMEEAVVRDGEVDTKILQDSLDRHQAKVHKYQQYTADKFNERRKMQQEHEDYLRNLQAQYATTRDQFRKDNLKYFTGG